MNIVGAFLSAIHLYSYFLRKSRLPIVSAGITFPPDVLPLTTTPKPDALDTTGSTFLGVGAGFAAVAAFSSAALMVASFSAISAFFFTSAASAFSLDSLVAASFSATIFCSCSNFATSTALASAASFSAFSEEVFSAAILDSFVTSTRFDSSFLAAAS